MPNSTPLTWDELTRGTGLALDQILGKAKDAAQKLKDASGGIIDPTAMEAEAERIAREAFSPEHVAQVFANLSAGIREFVTTGKSAVERDPSNLA